MITLHEVLKQAEAEGVAIGHFNVSDLVTLKAVFVAVEQASTLGWERYVGPAGRVIGMKTFGASAPLKELQRRFGFEPDKIAAAAKELLRRR